MKRSTLSAILEAKASKTSLVLATNLDTQDELLIDPLSQASTELEQMAAECAQRDQSREVEVGGVPYFLNVFNPPLRLILIGAVHIAQPLARMATLNGYEVFINDPREAFASKERFPDVEIVPGWPDEAVRSLGPDRRTAIVTLSHDPKIDDPALEEALHSQCFYIGALGSKRTHAARLQRLTEADHSKTQLSRIHGPVGLSIGAKSPSEIAISILAEMTQTLRIQSKGRAQEVAAIVLAAGLSTRMGKTNKLLTDIGGKPMIRHIVDRVAESRVSKTYVVVGHEHIDVSGALQGADVEFVENSDFEKGLSSSIKTGLKALPSHLDGAVICLGDMPLVSARLLNTLLDRFHQQAGRSICVPTYKGKRGNPVLWPAALFSEMLSIEGDVGARDLIDHHPDLLQEVSQPDGAVLFDIDTHEDVDLFRKEKE
jgi:xanthine dehydrogenase accessory factor